MGVYAHLHAHAYFEIRLIHSHAPATTHSQALHLACTQWMACLYETQSRTISNIDFDTLPTASDVKSHSRTPRVIKTPQGKCYQCRFQGPIIKASRPSSLSSCSRPLVSSSNRSSHRLSNPHQQNLNTNLTLSSWQPWTLLS